MSAMLDLVRGRALARADVTPAGGRGYLDCVLGLVRARLGHAVLLAALVTAIELLRVAPLLPESRSVFPRVPLEIFALWLTKVTLIVVAVTAALGVPARGWRRAALVFASLAVALTAAGLIGWLHSMGSFAIEDRIVVSREALLMVTLWRCGALGAGLSIYYVLQEREAELAAAARDAELRRLRLQRTVMQSRLEVIQARVEPEFLFGALDDLQRLYRSDSRSADRMVDELIVYLRAALPQIRGGLSTVGREVELVRAFAAVLQVPRGTALVVDSRVEASVTDHPMPPMVLLPIAQSAFDRNTLATRRRITIDARQAPGGAAITLEVEGGPCPDRWDGEGVPASRRTLAACYDDGSTLKFDSTGDRHRAEIGVPPDADPPAGARRELTAG